jgi:glycerol kinase
LRKHETTIREFSGLPLTPYYFAPKLRMVLQDNPRWQEGLQRGDLLAGTLDTFLVWRWTGGRHFITDASMAARTQLMEIRKQQWSSTLCDLFGIPMDILPGITSSSGMNINLDNGLILQASVADQSAALIASVSVDSAEALVNLGTGCFVVRYVPDFRTAPAGYLHTLVYQDREQQIHLAIEGTINSIAAAIATYPVGECEVEDLGRDEIFCLAESSGLGAPYFRGELGIRFSQSVEHLPQRRIAVLLLEAVIFRVARILEEFHRECAFERVYLSGGLSGLNCLQQGIAMCVPFPILHLKQSEASLHGTALLAAGMAPATCRESQTITIDTNNQKLPEKYLRWKAWLDELLVS